MTDKKKDQDHEKAKHVQQKFMEYQMLEQQLKQMQQQLEKLDEQKKEAALVENNLDDFNHSEKGSEVLVPISGGIFFQTTLSDSRKFLVNVGQGVVVEKDLEGVKGLVKEQVKDIDRYHDQMMTEFTRSALKYQMLEEELKHMVDD